MTLLNAPLLTPLVKRQSISDRVQEPMRFVTDKMASRAAELHASIHPASVALGDSDEVPANHTVIGRRAFARQSRIDETSFSNARPHGAPTDTRLAQKAIEERVFDAIAATASTALLELPRGKSHDIVIVPGPDGAFVKPVADRLYRSLDIGTDARAGTFLADLAGALYGWARDARDAADVTAHDFVILANRALALHRDNPVHLFGRPITPKQYNR